MWIFLDHSSSVQAIDLSDSLSNTDGKKNNHIFLARMNYTFYKDNFNSKVIQLPKSIWTYQHIEIKCYRMNWEHFLTYKTDLNFLWMETNRLSLCQHVWLPVHGKSGNIRKLTFHSKRSQIIFSQTRCCISLSPAWEVCKVFSSK